MIILPAIDIYEGKAVRLIKGDYNQMTVYSDDPLAKAREFYEQGARYVHIVDLEGARDGSTPNAEIIIKIIKESGLQVEIGGGIRSRETAEMYLGAGAMRVILGTSAVTDTILLQGIIKDYGERIAAGIDIRAGRVAIKGWQELSQRTPFFFTRDMISLGVKTIICTDISKDGVLAGTNDRLYAELNTLGANLIASGGITTIEDLVKLKSMGLYGAILGRSIYEGTIDLREAVLI